MLRLLTGMPSPAKPEAISGRLHALLAGTDLGMHVQILKFAAMLPRFHSIRIATGSGEHFPADFAFVDRRSLRSAFVQICQHLVIDAQEMQDRGVQIVNV